LKFFIEKLTINEIFVDFGRRTIMHEKNRFLLGAVIDVFFGFSLGRHNG